MRETPAEFRRRHRATALAAASVFVVMVGLAYASVPLYRMFCSATGYGGTPRIEAQAPSGLGTRVLNVRFDANVGGNLPWRFEPETPQVTLRSGKVATVYYRAENRTGEDLWGRAEYNISPEVGGFFFDKISCFCFDVQHLGPHETAEWPVVFYLDPALDRDPSMRHVETLTLSYTLHAAAKPSLAAGREKGQDTPKL